MHTNNLCMNTCPIGFWGNSTTMTCEPCHGICETCTGPTDTDCILCQTSPRLYKSSDDSKCYPNCSDGKWINTIGYICDHCHSSCKTCNGGTDADCILCQDSSLHYRSLVDNKCYTICPDGTWLNNITKTCDPCHNTCKTCTGGNDTDCILC